MYTTDYSKFCSNETVKEWKIEPLGKIRIKRLNIPKLIELYGGPEIDPIHFRKILDKTYYEQCLKNGSLNLEDETQPADFFIQPYIHWNILDENNQIEAIIHIEFYEDIDYKEGTSYSQRNKNVDYFFSTELMNNLNYKKQLIEDFINLNSLNSINYPGLNGLSEFDFSLDYLESEYVQWFIRVKNKETFDKLSFLF
jgi:hypothetical protein